MCKRGSVEDRSETGENARGDVSSRVRREEHESSRRASKIGHRRELAWRLGGGWAGAALRLFDDEQHDKDDRYDGAERGPEESAGTRRQVGTCPLAWRAFRFASSASPLRAATSLGSGGSLDGFITTHL